LAELDALDGDERLEGYPFFSAARGEQLLRVGKKTDAHAAFTRARELARSPSEERYLDARIAACMLAS
jgi:RNA polymerase sigma-70 factor (ECF subfamily)